MNCPKCGAQRALTDRVCRRCKYFFDEDRFIEIASPGSWATSAAGVSARRGVWAVWRGRLQLLQHRPWVRALQPFPTALVPGLPQALNGKRRRGAVFLGIVCGLLGGAIILFPSNVGSVLFGAAVSVQAYGAFEESTWARHPEWNRRFIALGCIQGVLMIFYYPLFEALRWWRSGPLVPVATYPNTLARMLPYAPYGLGFVLLLLWVAALCHAIRTRRRQAK